MQNYWEKKPEPFVPDEQGFKEVFEPLSVKRGGSLLCEPERMYQEEVTVFIGLGGLGCRTVNAIKATANRKLNNSDKRFYLCIDTDEHTLRSLSNFIEIDDDDVYGGKGCIDKGEKLLLACDGKRVAQYGVEVDSWIDREEFSEIEVDNRGAQGIRQLGRLMLLADGNYDLVYERLREVLNDARSTANDRNVGIQIYFVAGLCGGTGGAIIDLAYMIRRVMNDFSEHTRIEAILYTPEVQFADVGISVEMQNYMSANFYAAIKEIDFFYNNRSRGTVYKSPTGDVCDAYKKNIFDMCTLVSRVANGVEIAKNSNEVIKKVADAIILENCGCALRGVPLCVLRANHFYHLGTWWSDNCDGIGVDIPDWTAPMYASFDYNSCYLPLDELVTYGADLLIEKLSANWRMKDISSDELDSILKKHHLSSHKSFAETIFDISQCTGFFDVDKCMLPVDGFGPAKVKNCCLYLELMRETAETEGSTQRAKCLLRQAEIKQSQVFVDPILSLIEKAYLFPGQGPYYANSLLSGFLNQLKMLIEGLPGFSCEWERDLNCRYADLKKKADKYDGLISMDAGELDKFTNACRKYGEDYLKCQILKGATEYLVKIYNKLIEKKEAVFSIYQGVFENLVEVIKDDVEYVINPQRCRAGELTAFKFELASFEEGDEKTRRIVRFLNALVDSKSIDREARLFIDKIFGEINVHLVPYDGSEGQITAAEITEIIRNYFKNTFAEITEDIVGKLCVVAYSDTELTPESIADIWNDTDLRREILEQAADDITGKVCGQNKIMLGSIDPDRPVEKFCVYEGVCVGRRISQLAACNEISTSIYDTNLTEIVNYKKLLGFPINFLENLDRYKEKYDSFSCKAGMHLQETFNADEVGDWRYSLPEPYGYQTASFLGKYVADGRDVTEADKQTMTEIFKLAKKAQELGMLELLERNGDEWRQPYNYGLNWEIFDLELFDATDETPEARQQRSEIYDRLYRVAKMEKYRPECETFIDVLRKAGYRLSDPLAIYWFFPYHFSYTFRNNDDGMGDENNFGKFIVMLRSNPYWVVKLRKGVELFSRLREIYEEAVKELQDK